MHRDERTESDTLAATLGGNLSRRLLLKRATVLGLSMPAIAGLLAACGDDDDDDDDPDATAPPAGTTAPPAGTSAPEATATTGGGDATATEGGDAEPTATTGGEATAAATQPPAGEGKPGGTLIHGLLRDPIGFDPHINYGASSSSLQSNVYNGLVEYDLDGGIIGALAESFEVSEDGLELIFKLRQGVKFHQGQDFTAEDVIYNLDRILNEETGASRRSELSNVGSYEATDEFTVTMTLPQPYAVLLPVLATDETLMGSMAWFESGVDPVTEMNGTGPFMLDSFEPEVKYTLVKNPNYWKPGLPYLDSIEQIPIPDDNARVNALRSGEVNYIEYVPWQNMAEFEDDSNYSFWKGFETFNLVRFNPNHPPLDNKLVRQAMNYAIDRDAVIAVAFGGEGQPITVGLLPTDSPWYNQELDGHWTYDPEKAMALLEEAGVDPSTVSLDFAVATISVHSDTAQVVAQQLEDLGFTINIVQQDVPTLTERRTTGDYVIMQDGLSLSYPDPDSYSVYFDIGGSQYARGVNYENQTLADLLEQGRSEIDVEARKEIYKQFEEELLEDAPWLFILFRPQAEAGIAAVKGYTRIPGLGLDSQGTFEYIYLDEGD
jgi:ABC-type transport system substrate-binding protein